MVGGVALLVISIIATAKDASIFINLPGLLIVLGGTLAATLMSFPLKEVLRVFRVFRVFIIVLRNERSYEKGDIDEIVGIAMLLYQNKVLQAEDVIANLGNPFLRTGLQLVVDGVPVEDILNLLQWRITRLKAREHAEAQVYRVMGGYAPAFGMVGTLLGLVNMLYDMGGDSFGSIGVNMAVALITTFYGIVLSKPHLQADRGEVGAPHRTTGSASEHGHGGCRPD
jgi:chemotaxis protein MotA